jgi:hypothetical protein
MKNNVVFNTTLDHSHHTALRKEHYQDHQQVYKDDIYGSLKQEWITRLYILYKNQ